ncbi:MAG TPA: ABC transporter permease subunit, partial [Symbiobacteriaceae bacterium]|nr:ABC transporter permease subunit [Symbiobacteriaceae bacterium]
MLMKQHAKTEWVSVVVWSVILGAFGFFTVVMWDMAVTQGFMADFKALMDSLGPIRVLFGITEDLATFSTWLQFFTFGGWLSLLLLAFAAMFAVGIVTREMDRRTMEFLLSLPVARWQVILARWANMALALLILHMTMFVSVLLGAAAVGEEAAAARYLTAEVNGFLVMLAVSGFMLVVSMLTDDYGRGLIYTLGLGFGLYFFHLGTDQATGVLKTIRGALPFALYDTHAIIGKGEVPLGDMAALAAMAL